MKYQIRYQLAQTKKKNDLLFIRRWFLLAIFCFAALFGWLWYDGVFFFEFERSQQNAFVTEVNLVPVRGTFHSIKYLQAIHYTYKYQDQTFFGIKQIGKKLGRIQAGDTIEIEVLKRKPEISQIKYP